MNGKEEKVEEETEEQVEVGEEENEVNYFYFLFQEKVFFGLCSVNVNNKPFSK